MPGRDWITAAPDQHSDSTLPHSTPPISTRQGYRPSPPAVTHRVPASPSSLPHGRARCSEGAAPSEYPETGRRCGETRGLPEPRPVELLSDRPPAAKASGTRDS